jgi:DNA-binding response OmpR family regulator
MNQINSKRIKILLLDDEEDIAILFKEGLEIMGNYDVDTYTDPLKALNSFKPRIYDLVLVDIVMPNMSGFEFYAYINKIDTECKVCFFSASENSEQKIRNLFPDLKLKKNVLIQKPIRIRDLTNKIKEIIDE